jgi:phosphoenolpyruvate carboxykinase (ATP)
MSIRHTRALLRAALDGTLSHTRFRKEPYFGLSIPAHVPGIPDEVLDPRQSWADKAAYDRMAAQLVERFEANFASFEAGVGDDVKAVAIRKAA